MKKIVLLCLFSFGLVIAGGGENPPSSTALRKRTKLRKHTKLRKRTKSTIVKPTKKEVYQIINHENESTFVAYILSLGYWAQTSMMCGGFIPDRENDE